MEGVKDAIVDIRRLSPADGAHYYYGYYDNPAFDARNARHLCNKTAFWDRLPTAKDVCELGAFDLASGAWSKYAETRAFNFQQGAMLQWNPLKPLEEIIYNERSGCEYRTCVKNILTGAVRVLPRAVANVSQDGRHGLCINMNRVFDFRPGYGYSDVRDCFFDVPQPEDDGIFVMDMATGEERFIISYKEIGRVFGIDRLRKIVVNHITFSPNNRRLLFLIRDFPTPDSKRWTTGLGTINLDGTGLHVMNPMSMGSHYHWRDGEHLLIWATVKGVTGMHLIADQSDESVQLNPEFFSKDIHCIYSPDLQYIMGDGYPDSEGYRQIYLYNTATDKGRMILRVKSDPVANGDIRSDLHNRWSRDGATLSFDSTHEGFRGLYTADLSSVLI